MKEARKSAEEFLDLIRKSRLGKLKIYIGMSAGVGKTYRMLSEAHLLLKSGIDVQIGYIETHARKETQELLFGLPVISRKSIFYKGKELEDMDLQAILNRRPEVVIVDELAHTNIKGSKNEKRWQDVLEIISAGINVISAVNIQHIESLNSQIREITGIEVEERIPDSLLAQADEVVYIDLTADDLIARLKDGKIYPSDQIEAALRNFFTNEHLLQLRELALKEVASAVVRKVENEVVREKTQYRTDKLLCCVSSNEKTTRMLIRKTARLANYFNCEWYVLYVQREKEHPDKIPLDRQRHLLNNLKLAVELGGEVIKRKGNAVAQIIYDESQRLNVTTICIGKPTFKPIPLIFGKNFFNELLSCLSKTNIDLLIFS
ncbi:MAG: sensor protein KdpD [Dysgonamonadaceae bacterium]